MLKIKTTKDLDTGDAYTDSESYESINKGSENELPFTGLMAASRTPDMNIVHFSDEISDVEIMPGSDHPLNTEQSQKRQGTRRRKAKEEQTKTKKHPTKTDKDFSIKCISLSSQHFFKRYTTYTIYAKFRYISKKF